MAKEVMRHEKAKGKGNISKIQRHNQAEEKVVKAIRDEEIKSSGTTDIILENLKYNISFLKCKNFNDEIENQINEKMPGKTIRKDAVKLIDGIYTYSPEKTKTLCCVLHQIHKNDSEETRQAKIDWQKSHKDWWEDFNTMEYEEIKTKVNEEHEWVQEYFQACVEHEKRIYGTVINAEVHFHESTPHLHINTIPFLQDKEGNWKLSAKDIMGNKKQMSELQTLFHEEVGKKFGLERGECREVGAVKQHIKKEKNKLEELETKVAETETQVQLLNIQVNNLKNQKKEVEEALQDIVEIEQGLINIDSRISKMITKISSEIATRIQNTMQSITKTKNDLFEAIKQGKMGNLVFGQTKSLKNEIQTINQELDEIENDDYER